MDVLLENQELIIAFLGGILIVLQIFDRLPRLVRVVLFFLIVCLFVWPPQRRPVVAIKTAHNRYVSAMGVDWGWVVRAQTDRVDDFEEFTLICLEKRKVALQTWHKTEEGENRYVTAMDDQWHEHEDWHWVLRAETDEILPFEEFTLLDADSGDRRSCSEVVKLLEDSGNARVAFQTWHQKEDRHRLVTAMDDKWTEIEELHWVLRAETNVLGPSERFTLELLSWEWEISGEAYAITTIVGSLLTLSVFLIIHRRKSKTSPQPAEAGSESSDENARDEDEPQVESNSGG